MVRVIVASTGVLWTEALKWRWRLQEGQDPWRGATRKQFVFLVAALCAIGGFLGFALTEAVLTSLLVGVAVPTGPRVLFQSFRFLVESVDPGDSGDAPHVEDVSRAEVDGSAGTGFSRWARTFVSESPLAWRA